MRISSTSNFFPSIYTTLDINAIRSQRLFFRLLILEVLLLILIPATILLTTLFDFYTILRALPILLIFIEFSINLAWPTSKIVKNWQTLRSAAESVKKECMIYSVACPPYPRGEELEANKKLIRNINKILDGIKDKSRKLSTKESDALYFTESEKIIRASEFEERVNYYFKNRLEDQINWYRNKSNRNNSSDSIYKALMIFFFIVSGIVVIYTSVYQYNLIEAVDIMVAIILGMQTYGNARRFSELAITYNNTLFELESHKGSAQVDDEAKFCDFVFKIENTISREHSVWSIRIRKD